MKSSRNIILTSVLINLLVTIIIVGAGANYMLNQIEERAKEAAKELIGTVSASSDDVYAAVLDFREACGEHTTLLNLGMPESAFKSPDAFNLYLTGKEKDLAKEIKSIRATIHSPFIERLGSPLTDTLETKLKVIEEALERR